MDDDDTGMITLPSLAERHYLKEIRRPLRWWRPEVLLSAVAAAVGLAIWAF